MRATGPALMKTGGRAFVQRMRVTKTMCVAILLLGPAVFAFACGNAHGSGSPSPASPTETPAPASPAPTVAPVEGAAPEGLYGHGMRTGVPEIDTILDAWQKRDLHTLKALARLQQIECAIVVEGSGGPPMCPDGITNGTRVHVMSASACEGYWVYREGLEGLFEAFVQGIDGKEYFLYAAWHGEASDHRPAGYRIQFARSVVDDDIFSPQVVLDEQGRIFHFSGGCNPARAQTPPSADFVLQPKLGVQSRIDIPAGDESVQIRGGGDPGAVLPCRSACLTRSVNEAWGGIDIGAGSANHRQVTGIITGASPAASAPV